MARNTLVAGREVAVALLTGRVAFPAVLYLP